MKNVIPIGLLLLLSACFNLNDCNKQDCFTPPPDILFLVVKQPSGENLFSSADYTVDSIAVTDENHRPVKFELIPNAGNPVVFIDEAGWRTGIHSYTLSIGTHIKIDFRLQMETLQTNCCTFMEIKEFTVLNHDIEGDTSTGFVKVLIQT